MSAYNDVVNLVEGIANTINPGNSFVHGDAQKVFQAINDSVTWKSPMIVLQTFRQERPLNNKSLRTNPLLIFFAYQDTEDNLALQEQALIDQSCTLADAFIDQLDAQGIQWANCVYEPVYRATWGCVTGYLLSITLTTQHDVC